MSKALENVDGDPSCKAPFPKNFVNVSCCENGFCRHNMKPPRLTGWHPCASETPGTCTVRSPVKPGSWPVHPLLRSYRVPSVRVSVEGRTDFGSTGYGGPCPPEGDEPHRYVFTVYALDVPTLDLPPDATAARVGFSLNAHALDRATLTGRYGR